MKNINKKIKKITPKKNSAIHFFFLDRHSYSFFQGNAGRPDPTPTCVRLGLIPNRPLFTQLVLYSLPTFKLAKF